MADDINGIEVNQLRAIINLKRRLFEEVSPGDLRKIYLTPENRYAVLFNHPSEDAIMRLYGEMITAECIAGDYLPDSWNLTLRESAVYRALKEVLTPEEWEREVKYRKFLTGKAMGLTAKNEGKGIHEDIGHWASVGGKKRGAVMRDKKLGICGLTVPQRAEACRMATLARGDVPYDPPEVDYIIRLVNDPDYQHTRAQYRGSPDWARVQEEVNRIFGNNRTLGSLRGLIKRHKRNQKRRKR